MSESWEKEIKRIQEINRSTMKKIISVCDEYGIRYFLCDGGLLGAIRHKAFIPWDDDLDLAFPRKDYEKLINLPKEVWGEDYELVHYSKIGDGKRFLDFTTRVINLKEKANIHTYEKLGEDCPEKYQGRVPVDCFVMDNAHNSNLVQKIIVFKLKLIYGMSLGHRAYIDYSEYDNLSKAMIFFCSSVGKHIELKKLYSLYDKVSRTVSDNSDRYFKSNDLLRCLGYNFDKKWFDKTVKVNIDDDLVDAPAEYDKVLRESYGDYMLLPPEDQRRPDHMVIAAGKEYPRIGVSIVTYNRLLDLKKTLEAYEKQVFKPEFLIVVDNASGEDTREFLKKWESEKGSFKRIVEFLPQNTGGSGGFNHAMQRALCEDFEYLYIADDDATPQLDTLKILADYIKEHDLEKYAAVCSSVVDNGLHPKEHRCIFKKGIFGYVEYSVKEKEYAKPSFEIDLTSFVGSMIKREILEKIGPCRADFFIYNDDYEFSMRMTKEGKILCIPASKIHHISTHQSIRTASWRDYYATRNAVYTHKVYFGKYGARTRSVRRILKGLISFNPKKIAIMIDAIKDGKAGKLGINSKYHP